MAQEFTFNFHTMNNGSEAHRTLLEQHPFAYVAPPRSAEQVRLDQQSIGSTDSDIGTVDLDIGTGEKTITMSPTCTMGKTYHHINVKHGGGYDRICSQEFLKSLEPSILVIPENTELHYSPVEGQAGYYTLSLDSMGQSGLDISTQDLA